MAQLSVDAVLSYHGGPVLKNASAALRKFGRLD